MSLQKPEPYDPVADAPLLPPPGHTSASRLERALHRWVDEGTALVDRQQKWRARLKLPRESKWLDRYERALIRLLAKSPKAGKLLAA